MSAEDIPVEILVIIFKNLKGKDAIACRAVCRRWRDVVDSLPDDVWERYCCRDFRDPVAANKVSNLGFRELYKSLSLWSKVEEAEVVCKQMSEKLVLHFKILNNNTLALLVNNLDEGFSFYANQIEYYNIKNMELISTECFDLQFILYDENEKLIVLLGTDDRLWVVMKSNKKKLFLDHLCDDNPMSKFKLFDTDVYYINGRSFLCLAQLTDVDGVETVKNVELTEMRYSVVAFAHGGKNSVFILTDNGILLCYKGANMIVCIFLGHDEASTMITYLMEFGFDWTAPCMYKWLESFFDSKELGLPALKTSVMHCHNHIVLVGTPRRTVHIYKHPFKKNKSFKLYKAKPNKTIDMTECSRENWHTSIHQLGVVEILNGHRIIVLNLMQLFFVDLLHNTATKQNAPHTGVNTKNKSRKAINKSVKVNRTPLKNKVNKNSTKNCVKGNENKKTKTKNVGIKRVYYTRSMDKCLHSRNKKKD